MAVRSLRQACGHFPDGFRVAIDKQYADALQKAGIMLVPEADGAHPVPVEPGKGAYQAQPSAMALVQTLAMYPEKELTPLLSAHFVRVAAMAKYGVAVRAFRAMGIEPSSLAEAATAEIGAYRTAPASPTV